MPKTVYKVPFGEGYKILQHGNLIERASLARRYPLVAAATPEEILTSITRITLRQVESDLRQFVSEGNRVGSTYVPSLSEFATVVADNQTEDDVDPISEPSDLESSLTSEDEEDGSVVVLTCDHDDCTATFPTQRGKKIHMTKVHGAATISDAISERDNEAFAVPSIEEDELLAEDLDIFEDDDDLDDLFTSDKEPRRELPSLIIDDDDDDAVLGSLGID